VRETSARYSELVRAIFSVVGNTPLELEELIRASVALEVDRPEWAFLKDERLFVTRPLSTAALAGEFSSVGLINGAAPTRRSGVITVVLGFQSTLAAAAPACLFRKGMTPNAAFEADILTEVPVSGFTDTRYFTPTQEPNGGTREITVQQVAPAGTPFGNLHIVNNQAATPYGPALAILRPGGWIVAEQVTIATAMSGVFWGYEKTLVAAGARA